MNLPPLSPTQGGRSILPSALSVADVIVSTTNATISKVIRSATNSPISHAIIYAGNGMVIEAIGDGVVERQLSQALSDATLAVGYRLEKMNPVQAMSVVSFARTQANARRKYDFSGIVGQAGYQLDHWFLCDVLRVSNCDNQAARANLWMQSNKQFFCSELVAEAYRSSGVPLINAPSSRVSPQTITEVATSGTLSYVGHLRTRTGSAA